MVCKSKVTFEHRRKVARFTAENIWSFFFDSQIVFVTGPNPKSTVRISPNKDFHTHTHIFPGERWKKIVKKSLEIA